MAALVGPADPPWSALRAIVGRHGTPAYAYDLSELRARAAGLRAALPDGVEVLYSVKANPSLGLCEVLAAQGIGAEVSSIGELILAVEAGFPAEQVMVSGPHKSAQLRRQLRVWPTMLVSVDSVDELRTLAADDDGPRRLVLRLRPDFDPYGEMPMGADGRFGIPFDQLNDVRRSLGARAGSVVGFHVYAGYQVLDGTQAAANLAAAFELGLRAGDLLGVPVEVMDVGGGFGVPTDAAEPELDLDPVRAELTRQRAQLPPAARLMIELGRYLVATAGYYLTSVLGTQTRGGRPAVVVDGGIHQRPDLCGLELSRRAAVPVVLTESHGPRVPTDVLGCLCLPSDVLAEAAILPSLSAGDVLAFTTAGAYGLSAGPTAFLGHPAPPEIAFDGERLIPLRHRAEPGAGLRDQLSLIAHSVTGTG